MLFLFKSQVSTLSIRNFLISNVVLSSRSYDLQDLREEQQRLLSSRFYCAFVIFKRHFIFSWYASSVFLA